MTHAISDKNLQYVGGRREWNVGHFSQLEWNSIVSQIDPFDLRKNSSLAVIFTWFYWPNFELVSLGELQTKNWLHSQLNSIFWRNLSFKNLFWITTAQINTQHNSRRISCIAPPWLNCSLTLTWYREDRKRWRKSLAGSESMTL